MHLNRLITGSYDDYQILELIGKGGTSEVFKANALNKQKNPLIKSTTRACKILLDHLIDKEGYFKRFQHEAAMAKRLLHSNIVNVHDSGQVDGRPFLIMDYVDGPTLSNVYKAAVRLAPQRAIPIFLQIANAFQYAHERGVVHRDLKPSNIILEKKDTSEDFVRVVDFGIAKMISETTLATQMTKTGEVFGTPAYMSPEQCRGEQINERSDIYSLGILMYEVLTGKPPFEGNDSLSVLYKQLSETPKNIGNIDSDVRLVKKLEGIIFKCLEKNPDARYSKMRQIERDLETCLERNSSGSKAVAHLQQLAARFSRLAKGALAKPLSAKGWMVSIAGLCVVIALIALVVVQTSERQASERLTAFVSNNPPAKRVLNWIEPDAPAYARDQKLFQEMEKKFIEQEKTIRAVGDVNTEENFEFISKMVDAYLAAGSLTLADQVMMFADKIAVQLKLADSSDSYREVAELKIKRAQSALGQRNYPNCIAAAEQAIKLHETFKNRDPNVFASDTIPCWDLIGRAAAEQGDRGLAKQAFSTVFALAKENKFSERFPERHAFAFARASDYLIANGAIDEGRLLLKGAIVGWDLTSDRLNEGIALNKLGVTYLRENPKLAGEIFDKSIETLKQSPTAATNSIIGKVLLNEADACLALGALEKANYCQKEAKTLL